MKRLPSNRGLSAARNAGVDAARSQWVAFLDDDDEWFPRKLDIQLRTAQQSAFRDPIVACHIVKRSETADVILPRRLPGSNEPMSEYLFRRRRWFSGEGIVLSSALLTTKRLLQQVPFRAELKRHEDLDWLLRASRLSGSMVEFVPTAQPLAIWYKEGRRASMSSRKDWRFSFLWIQQNRELVTARAYASFLLTWVSANAIEQGDRSAFSPLVKEAYRNGTLSILDGMVFAGIWLIPQRLRRWLVCLSAADGSASTRRL